MNITFEKVTRIILIILLCLVVYNLFEISKNGRYQLSISNEKSVIIDTRTGKTQTLHNYY